MGRNTTTGVVEIIAQSKFATPAMLDQAIIDLVGGAPGALNTLIELANALNNDATFGADVINSLATKAPLVNTLQLTSRSSVTGIFDANNWIISTSFAGIKWIDGNASHLNLPISAGVIFQVDALFGTGSAAKYMVQHYYASSRYYVRLQNNGVWGSWNQVSTVAA